MIFVTVGTHEQQFNRLTREIVKLYNQKIIRESIYIQYGYSDFIETKNNLKAVMLIDSNEMDKLILNCKIPITHGGPATFISCLKLGKIPIVIPRRADYEEHVNNHQLEFCLKLKKRGFPIIVVEDIGDLCETILNYNTLVEGIKLESFVDNTGKFVKQLKKEINELFS